jgi:hypothetical protein
MTRTKPGRCLAAVAALWLLAVLPPADARAEASHVRGEGQHRVEHEAFIDLGRYVDCVTWRYVVQADETLGEIAQRELGSATRHREILALNAGLKPKSLWAGARIVMPPRSTGCEGKGPKWVFFAWSPDAHGWAAPRQLVEGAVHRVSHGARLYAVPAASLHAVLGKATESGLDGRVLEREAGVARSGFVTLVEALPDADPTERIVTRWRVESVADGHIALVRVGEERFDALGQAIALPRSSSSRPGTLLLLLSFALMLAVAGLAVARTQRLREAPDEDLGGDPDGDEAGTDVAGEPLGLAAGAASEADLDDEDDDEVDDDAVYAADERDLDDEDDLEDDAEDDEDIVAVDEERYEDADLDEEPEDDDEEEEDDEAV